MVCNCGILTQPWSLVASYVYVKVYLVLCHYTSTVADYDANV